MSVITKKICLIGDFNVGKTSLIRRFVENKFSDQYLTTVGMKLSRKSVFIDLQNTRKQIDLLIWDIEGETKQKPIQTKYLKGSQGAIIVGDMTRIDTLRHISNHLNLFLKINPQSKVVVALNKHDLLDEEKIKKLSELYSFKEHVGVISAYTTSAKTGDRVDEMFQALAQAIA